MTREEAKDFLPIIKAYAEGKEIEYKDRFTNNIPFGIKED